MTREHYKILSMASGMTFMVTVPEFMERQEDLRDWGFLTWSHDHPNHHSVIAYKITDAGRTELAKGPPSR